MLNLQKIKTGSIEHALSMCIQRSLWFCLKKLFHLPQTQNIETADDMKSSFQQQQQQQQQQQR